MFSRAASTILRRSCYAVAARSGTNLVMQTSVAVNGTAVASLSATDFPKRPFTSSSHDDFAPKRKVVEGEDEALKLIQEHVDSNPIMLYMKGNPSMPMCGFSARVVQVLQAEGVDFSSVNVLDYPDIREGVKKFSQWPTIPQLYVKGEFVGGCDIVTQMHESGELKDVLAEAKEE